MPIDQTQLNIAKEATGYLKRKAYQLRIHKELHRQFEERANAVQYLIDIVEGSNVDAKS